jgi:antitoxin (DNA-binding transcriptional repressor) of toxin-antitoxin stability system
MEKVRINDAQARLVELVDSLGTSDEILITRDEKPIARLTSTDPRPSLSAIRPSSVGAVFHPLTSDDDLLEEMLGG